MQAQLQPSDGIALGGTTMSQTTTLLQLELIWRRVQTQTKEEQTRNKSMSIQDELGFN